MLFTTTSLFFLGCAAVASPIIIHLLNKRKFKRVDWAAMDFLLEADKKNRRRVRLENLILLLLRCAACVLIGALVARPFIPVGLTAGIFGANKFERIVLLDDSLSMQVKDGSTTAMESAKEALAEFVRGLADNGSSETLTLYLTSDPTQPIRNGEKIDSTTAGEIAADLEEQLAASDRPANLASALLHLEKSVKGEKKAELNRIVYVISDMRKRDWPAEAASDEQGVTATLRRIAGETAGCFLVDVGREDDVGNVFVEEVRSKEKALVAGVPSEFEVKIRNTGGRDVDQAKVQFVASFADGGQSKLDLDVKDIPKGGEKLVPFQFAFTRDETAPEGGQAQAARVSAQILPPADAAADELEADNTRYFAARIVPGIKTLIVDGDRLPEAYKSESFFLNRALAPPGHAISGMAVDVVGEAEFENLRLDDYQIIYLCNLYRIPDAGDDVSAEAAAGAEPRKKRLSRREQLEQWVAAGGGLVIAMGDRLDEELYNEELYRDGKGLLPVKLVATLGDLEEQKWVKFNVPQRHPIMALFYDEPLFVERAKIFRWWDCLVDETDLADGKVNVVARFTNTENSPAIVEKQFGKGRVVAFTTPLDKDWSDWPIDQSYPATMLALNEYLARPTAEDANVQVGEVLHQGVDLTQFELDVGVKRPDQEEDKVSANPGDQQDDQVLYGADYDKVDRQGFYELLLNRREAGGMVPMLFAANVDPDEGDLARADTQEFQRKLGDANVKFVSRADLLKVNVEDARRHLWPFVLGALVGVLCLEQFLGWRFGRNR